MRGDRPHVTAVIMPIFWFSTERLIVSDVLTELLTEIAQAISCNAYQGIGSVVRLT